MLVDWNEILTSVIISGVTAVILTGGTNNFLQKKNRKANIVYEKGLELVDKVISINQKRVETTAYITLFHGVPKDELRSIYTNYVNSIMQFEVEIKKSSVFLNKKTLKALNEYIPYLKEVQVAVENVLNERNEFFSINFTQNEKEIVDKIILLIKKSIS